MKNKEEKGESMKEEEKEITKEHNDTMRPGKKKRVEASHKQALKDYKEVGAKIPSKSSKRKAVPAMGQKPVKGHAAAQNVATKYRNLAKRVNAKGTPKVKKMSSKQVIKKGMGMYDNLRAHK